MSKKTLLGPTRLMYPRPTFLVGVTVNGKPNFITIGGGGVACAEPPMLCLPIRHHQYSLKGIYQNLTFSVNIPSASQVKEVDFCGLNSGAKVDKVKSCGFTLFYGKLETAPMIQECPLSLECRVVHILNLGAHAFVIGEVKETYISEDCITDGKPDVKKIDPMVPALEQGLYLSLGEILGKTFSTGREIQPKS